MTEEQTIMEILNKISKGERITYAEGHKIKEMENRSIRDFLEIYNYTIGDTFAGYGPRVAFRVNPMIHYLVLELVAKHFEINHPEDAAYDIKDILLEIAKLYD